MVTSITNQRPRSRDLLTRMAGGRLYQEAYKQGMSLSAWLEREDPSSEYNDGLDAFERLLKTAGIVTQSDPERGFYADTFGAFDQNDETRGLVPEWMARQWRRAASGRNPSTRNLFTSADSPPPSTLQPVTYAPEPRGQQLAPPIPLSEIVAVTTPIDTGVYQAFYLTDDPANQRMVRIAQGAEIPRAKITGKDNAIRLKKFGRALEVTYEDLRRMRIDLVAILIGRMAVQAEKDKVSAVLDVIVNGDGNANTAAASYNLTAIDPATTANNLTLKGWLGFKLKFYAPYMATTALVQEGAALSLMTLNTGTANIPLVVIQASSGFGMFRSINPGLADSVALGWTADAPAGKVVAFDRRFAIERVTEIGGNISEVERYVTRQTQAITLTEVEGYAVFDPNATKVLNLGA